MNTFSPSIDWVTCLLSLFSLAGWVGVRWVLRRGSNQRTGWLLMAVSLMAAWYFWSSALGVLDSLVETAGTWPRELLAFGAAIACEAVLTLYVDRRSTHRALSAYLPIAARLIAIAVLTVILLEPVVSHHHETADDRFVAILLDESASMNLSGKPPTSAPSTPSSIRRDVARRVLTQNHGLRPPILDELEADYRVKLYQFAARSREIKVADWREYNSPTRLDAVDDASEPLGDVWTNTTDIAAALKRVDRDLPVDELSGILLLTDGCDHSQSDLQQAARRLTRQQSPIHSVVIGNQTPIKDAEVVAVWAPHQVFQGDRIAVKASIKIDKYKGRSVKLRMISNGESVDEKTLRITSQRHRETVTFRHQSEGAGIHEYTIELEPLPDEAIETNNTAACRVSVSEDRIRVLIVEDRPRWEFRYLRNLFAGRDRTVFLQHVLLRPDRLAGVPDPPILHASASRAFDDCEATALPRTRAEWLKFDVIVLGDVAPGDLGDEGMRTLESFVKDRGGTLVVIAGRGYMPHAFAQTPIAELLPVHLDDPAARASASPDRQFHFQVTPAAHTHVIMQQSVDPIASAKAWDELPLLYWRHPACRAKVGATVLAYASQVAGNVDDRQQQRDRALVLWHRFGAGKVLQLAFDQTWRLRYGVGDRHHHQFWGQVLRWSVQDRLAGGTDLVRLGTDRMLYQADDTVTVRARLVDMNRNPASGDDTQAVVYLDNELVSKVMLAPQPNSGGMLQGKLTDLGRPGKYRIQLTGPTVDRLLELEGREDETVFTEFGIQGTDSAVEAADVVADPTVPTQLADWTGGMVCTPENAHEILAALGPKSTFHREQWILPLWNRWWVILLFLGLVSAEWMIRKSNGLI